MKYMGSKAKLAKEIAPIINEIIRQENISVYVEPFVGGANMIEHIECSRKIGADKNKYLIAMWNRLQEGWKLPNDISKELFYEVKKNKEVFPPELVSAVGFLASYNARWFDSYAGTIETKQGNIRDYYDEAKRNVEKQLKYVMDVEFRCCDYTEFTDVKGALVYCDPPYSNTKHYEDKFDTDKFWDWVRKVSENNIVLVSEYGAPSDFNNIFSKAINVSIDCKNTHKATEKLFTTKSVFQHISKHIFQ